MLWLFTNALVSHPYISISQSRLLKLTTIKNKRPHEQKNKLQLYVHVKKSVSTILMQ
jgi:hypothetical protein